MNRRRAILIAAALWAFALGPLIIVTIWAVLEAL